MHWTAAQARPTIRRMSTQCTIAFMLFATSAWPQPQTDNAGLQRPYELSGSAGDRNEYWVTTWSTSLHQPDLGVPGLANAGFNNQTVRQIVHTTVGGRHARVRLSAFGANEVVFGALHIALPAAGPAIVPGSDRALTFGGRPSITIPPGASVLSDPIAFDVPVPGDLAVSIFVPGKPDRRPGILSRDRPHTFPRLETSQQAPSCRLPRRWSRGSGWQAWK
jgi:hypothetical protein